ncbi:MAG: stage II sporulation protein R [Clostridia bacterium]|nr:stage II sporulation protein R [Clostridia bacterium]
MKKFRIIFFLFFIIILTALVFPCFAAGNSSTVNERYLRIHIRADSDLPEAQAVKYAVRDGLVAYLSPSISQVDGFDDAKNTLKKELDAIERVAESVLRGHGFDYGATATLRIEKFPTRVYGEYTLEEGEYLALIVELGSGEGQNWWCVVYPPLCFAGQNNVPIKYKSKLLELIERWKTE